jgi:hypothetical protein
MLVLRQQIVVLLILVVDDEPDVEMLFRAQFRRDLRQGRFRMEFAHPATWRFNASLKCKNGESAWYRYPSVNSSSF